LQGATSTQPIRVSEVFMGGQAVANAPSIMLLAHDSTVGATLTALASPNTNGPLHRSASTLANPPVGFVAGSTTPPRSNSTTKARSNHSLKACGGLIGGAAGQDEEFWIIGNPASDGEASLSAFSGGTPGLMGSHIVYEPF